MTQPKLFVIGENSLIGSTLMNYAKNDFQIQSSFHNVQISQNSYKIDLIAEADKLLDILKKFKPNHVVHTVAYPNVDFCETSPKDADFLHIDITKKIAELCSKIDAKLYYFSTDAVFDGKLNKKYVESDSPNPLSHYGKTKLQAEKLIMTISPNNVVLRTTVVYGATRKSRFTNWVLTRLKNKQPVPAFTDQSNTPTLVDDLSKVLIKIFNNDISGIFHASGKSCLSRYDFAKKLAKKFSLNETLVIPTLSSEMSQIAPRPEKGCLDSRLLEELIDFQFCTIDQGIDFIFKNQTN